MLLFFSATGLQVLSHKIFEVLGVNNKLSMEKLKNWRCRDWRLFHGYEGKAFPVSSGPVCQKILTKLDYLSITEALRIFSESFVANS